MKAPVVLLAEDEVLVADLIQDCLLDAGYEVVVAESGAAALRWVEGDAPLDGLITDIRMGEGPDGWALARRARELRPDLAVVYMSGDSEADWVTNRVPDGLLVPKPFSPMQVVVAIQAIFEKDRVPQA
jgi:CheY-like chemotaxis protein